ncbi:phage tail protein [Listeria welshimeri]|uniref:Minor structural protein n=1 Tax=Listeria welshimeri TaxID=1643 RepID=A0ABX4IF24_LISWE|nr:phage tail protein [Listeria welshimeri]MBC1251332.1 hypothetical protein [Listeria welshimeri]MBC1446893.1 hypothetical protein [Listeria welshimeri]MBC1654067.1 hypothetical protein [Listeria welshimeri]MBC1660454.1 hypothetical protein [Listeria welshimeri]MBC1668462.1 hypothetical protein [Listeria welshimeri]
MDYLIVKSMDNGLEEILIDIDYDSFSYDYEKNTSRSISFGVRKTKNNEVSFNILGNEAIITYRGQQFVVKKCVPKVVGAEFSKQVTAQHICYTIQDHVQYEVKTGEKNYSIHEALDFAICGNKLGFTFQVIGAFPTVKLENLGDKNALELINLFIEKFNAILFADNKRLCFYNEATWYQETEKQFRYLYNTEDISLDINTDNLKTVIKCYGKQKENADKLTGDNKYQAVVTYVSPNKEIYGYRMANSKSTDTITNNTDLLMFAKEQIMDIPETSLSLTYRGTENITERDIWFLRHEPLGFETEVYVTRLKTGHPFSVKPQEVGFSNARRDMVRIQAQMASQLKETTQKANKINTYSTMVTNAYDARILTEVVGVVNGD